MHKTDDALERIAQIVFEHRHFQQSANVKWTPGGNSIKQDEARDIARAILAVLPQYTGAAEVTQVDRDAAAELFEAILGPTDWRAQNARLGNMDDLPSVQMLSRHRAAGFAAGAADTKKLKNAGTALALAAGVLNVRLDGQEKYRAQRQGVLDAMTGWSDAIAALPKEPST